MRILVANDDGIYSPGIAALARAARAFGDVRVVAPDVEQSSAGHAITSSRPVRVPARPRLFEGIDAFRVNGTPADCVALGAHLWEQRRPRALRRQPRPEPRQRYLALGHARRGQAGDAARHPRHRAERAGHEETSPTSPASSRGSTRALETLLLDEAPGLVNVNFPLEPAGCAGPPSPSSSTTAAWSPTRTRWAASSTGSRSRRSSGPAEGTDLWAVEQQPRLADPAAARPDRPRGPGGRRPDRALERRGGPARVGAGRPCPKGGQRRHTDDRPPDRGPHRRGRGRPGTPRARSRRWPPRRPARRPGRPAIVATRPSLAGHSPPSGFHPTASHRRPACPC